MVSDSIRVWVRARAAGRCEYCQLPELYSSTRFQIDHIIAQSHEGDDDETNLAWSCTPCNLSKGPNVGSIDFETGVFTRLFNPRLDIWQDHFGWHGAVLIGTTLLGRATVKVLQVNRPKRIEARRILIELNCFHDNRDG